MRILVTGAAGFVGSHVVRLLAQEGHDVHAVVRNVPRGGLPDCGSLVSPVALDLRDSARVRAVMREIRPECAIHLAWYTAQGQYWTSPENFPCVEMSLSLAQALADSGCRRLVAAGTCAEYDWRYGFHSEGVTPCHPHTLYGAAKYGLYLMLDQFCRLAKIELAWTRFFFLYGPGEHRDRLVPYVARCILEGKRPRCTDGEQIRDFLHVEDAAGALCAVARSPVSGAVNIASGAPITVRSLLECLARLADQAVEVEFGAVPRQPGEPRCILADVRRLADEVGWRPSRTLQEGLVQTLGWWREARGRS